MKNLARGVTRLNRWIGKWASLAVLILFALLLADVVMRYLVGQPAIWTAELATLIFGVYAIIAGGYLLAERGHVNVDIFYGGFSRKRKALVDIVNEHSHTCYRGVRGKRHDWGYGCGDCPACDLRAKGWAGYRNPEAH